jgi:hypothetical protein
MQRFLPALDTLPKHRDKFLLALNPNPSIGDGIRQ